MTVVSYYTNRKANYNDQSNFRSIRKRAKLIACTDVDVGVGVGVGVGAGFGDYHIHFHLC